jgi:hypothetical protein
MARYYITVTPNLVQHLEENPVETQSLDPETSSG